MLPWSHNTIVSAHVRVIRIFGRNRREGEQRTPTHRQRLKRDVLLHARLACENGGEIQSESPSRVSEPSPDEGANVFCNVILETAADIVPTGGEQNNHKEGSVEMPG